MNKLFLPMILVLLMSACKPATQDVRQSENSVSEITPEISAVVGEVEAELMAANVATAEALIDAFYSFDPERLKPMLADAPESADAILYYQGWAEGGNYKVLERSACQGDSPALLSCAITVQDDPVLALKTGFNVTDTFTIAFTGSRITAVDTSSNDQPIYYAARDWVLENNPDIMTGPCQGFFAGGTTPADCARAMAAGYRQYYAEVLAPGKANE